MRLHHLSVTAFGPFAGSEQIDFEELNDAGLFLLTGPTGAGKTSVLDAICFALYGTVPGARGVKTLKSHHAATEIPPEVVLDFSVADRRFRILRSPAWSRPKRRGTGMKDEQATATLLEVVADGEHFLSSRAQEVGHLVNGLIGMSASQFSQVALLPQGEFATFLRATSAERHDVLQHLFRTDRFARIESWVQDHSKELRDRSADEERAVQRLVDAVADRAGADPSDELSGDQLAAAANDGRLLRWAGALTADAAGRLAASERALADCQTAEEELRNRYDAVKQAAADATRRRQAEQTLAALHDDADAATRAEAALATDLRAARCLPLLRGLDEAADAAERAAARWAAHRADVAASADAAEREVTAAFLARRVRAARSALDRLETLLPRERARREARDVLLRTSPQITGARSRIAELNRRRERLPGERDALRRALADAQALAHQRERLFGELDLLRGRLAAARAIPEAQASLRDGEDRLREATDAAQAARSAMQRVIARRLAEMASELAGRLADGRACQVCGSVEHPAPATVSSDAVTEQEQEEATAADEAADAARERARRVVAEREQRVGVLAQAAGDLDGSDGRTREAELSAALGAATAAEPEVRRLEERLGVLETELEEIAHRLRSDEAELATMEHTVATATATIETADAEISAVFPDAGPHRSLEDLRSAQGALLVELEAAERSCTTHEAVAHLSRTERERAAAVAADEGFDSPEHARAGCLDEARRKSFQALLAERAERHSRAQAVLDSLGEPPAEADPTDLAAVEADLARARTHLDAATRAFHEQESTARSLATNLARLEGSLAAWGPVRDEHLRAESMARLVRGQGGDNHRQVRLSAYVLARQLDQVVDAANERLAQMRDQRYLLERTGRAARKGSQSGLGLDIIDEWTGEVRDPATLSGGETFVVSLSLALGLADVVTHEAGGTEIETLFVDEGFGSLDPDTLDDVMDRLDGLRDGGRTVGLVSHVGELRNRIPTQVHVDKQRTGSTISVRTLIA